jgi:hypothetical protein
MEKIKKDGNGNETMVWIVLRCRKTMASGLG